MPHVTAAEAPALLEGIAFSPIHDDWLLAREAALEQRLAALDLPDEAQILLVNATLGKQLYPSITDFFATLQRVRPGVRTTSCSYFTHIHDLGRAVMRKGLATVTVERLASMSDAQLERFDLVLGIGPSDAFMELMCRPALRARLVLLDLAFYHQQIEGTDQAFLERDYENPRRGEQRHPVVCYSCQPEAKVVPEVVRILESSLLSWEWFDYIPAGFAYADAVQASGMRFDLALLGAGGRDYGALDADALAGLRVLFLGDAERVPEVRELASTVDVTFVDRVDEAVYGRLIAASRCVLLPMGPWRFNVLLSVVDALVGGVPLVMSRRPGTARLEARGAPIVLGETAELCGLARDLLADEVARADLSERSVRFAREHLDIYGILLRILEEQPCRPHS